MRAPEREPSSIARHIAGRIHVATPATGVVREVHRRIRAGAKSREHRAERHELIRQVWAALQGYLAEFIAFRF